VKLKADDSFEGERTHEHLVAGTVDEADVAREGHSATAVASGPALGVARHRCVARRFGTLAVVAPVDLGVGITCIIIIIIRKECKCRQRAG
jgi:hypothetical protein